MARIGIVILAAGNSSRMGRPKQLLEFNGKPLIRHAVEAALASACQPVQVVCGDLAPEVREALEGLAVTVTENPQWSGGMGTSIQAGLRGFEPDDLDGVILTLGDLPLVTGSIYDRLVAEHAASGKPIVTSEYAGTVGVPVLFMKPHFAALLALAPSQGCKGVIQANAGEALRIACPEAEVDVDTPADYAMAQQLFAGR